jgi:hypothetical protein
MSPHESCLLLRWSSSVILSKKLLDFLTKLCHASLSSVEEILEGATKMRLGIASLAVLCLALASASAWAGNWSYDNGPICGAAPASCGENAWNITNYIVSDTFFIDNSVNKPTATNFMFGAWELPGDTMLSVDWSLTAAENGGTIYGQGTATGGGGSGGTLTDTFISVNAFGYNTDKITVTGLNVEVVSGAQLWLNLQNAVESTSGDVGYWDESDGVGCGGSDGKGANCPSLASENVLGTIPSESFTIGGTPNNGTTPEPSGIMLFGSGTLGLVGILRRKIL